MDRCSFFGEGIPGADLEELKGKLIVINLPAITAGSQYLSRLAANPSTFA
jgi:hypothetical protein